MNIKHIALVFFLFVAPNPSHAADFDHNHEQFTSVLQAHVSNGAVNYKTLKASRSALDTYLDALAAVSKQQFTSWDEPQQVAFLTNLYNAQTLGLIIDNYPVKSIKDIGSFWRGPWKQKVVRLFGKTEHLDHVEHEILRKRYNRPEIHFALVCAAKGCPPLREEAYTAEKLDGQFKDQGVTFLQNQRKNRVDVAARRLYLSPIFKWFKEDFTKKSGTLQSFVAPYVAESERTALLGGTFSISYTDYDWSLNEQ